jgi:hypothetical protein
VRGVRIWGPTERVHLVGVSISFENNFYRLSFTPPLWSPVLQTQPQVHHVAVVAPCCYLCRRLSPAGRSPSRGAAVPHHGVLLAHFVELFSLPHKMQSSSPLSILKPKQIKAPSVLFPIARTSRSYPLQSADQAFFLASISTRPSKEQAADVRLGFSPLVFFLLSVSQHQAAVPSPLLQFTQEAIGTTNQCTHATSVNRPRVLFSLPRLLELLSLHPKNSIFCCCSPANAPWS